MAVHQWRAQAPPARGTTHIYADPRDTNMVYALNVGFFRSRDGGKTFPQTISVPHGDSHDLWIAPTTRAHDQRERRRRKRLVQRRALVERPGLRDGAVLSRRDDERVSVQDLRRAAGQLDAVRPESQARAFEVADWFDAGGGESGYVTPHPTKPDISRRELRRVDDAQGREDRLRAQHHGVAEQPDGQSSEDIPIRFQWTYPIVFSRHSPNVVYAAGLPLPVDERRRSWTRASPDLAARPKTMGPSGGPITKDQTGVETYALIFAFDESPVTPGLLWAGTDDGYIWVSRNNGANWTNVTPKDIGDFTRVSIMSRPVMHPAAPTSPRTATSRATSGRSSTRQRTVDADWTRIVTGSPRPSSRASSVRTP